MYCQQCGKVLEENDIDRESGIANCQNCYGLSDFSSMPDMAVKNISKRRNVPLPAGVKVEKTGRSLLIKTSWFGGCSSIFLIVFAVIWDTGLIAGLLSSKDIVSFLPVMMFHGTAGVIITYIALTMILNQTVFEVNELSLSVKHGPLPWPGNQNIFSSDVSQLYCKKDHTRRKNKKATFCLNAKMKDGSEKTLLSWLESPEQALFVEQEIEEFLKIEDRPVSGELKK